MHQLYLGKIPYAIFIDLLNAFDTIGHQIVISKLHSYDIRNYYLNLIENYLKIENSFLIVLNHIYYYINTGVPHDSYWDRC